MNDVIVVSAYIALGLSFIGLVLLSTASIAKYEGEQRKYKRLIDDYCYKSSLLDKHKAALIAERKVRQATKKKRDHMVKRLIEAMR